MEKQKTDLEIFKDWLYEDFFKEMDKNYAYSEYIPEIQDCFLLIDAKVDQIIHSKID